MLNALAQSLPLIAIAGIGGFVVGWRSGWARGALAFVATLAVLLLAVRLAVPFAQSIVG